MVRQQDVMGSALAAVFIWLLMALPAAGADSVVIDAHQWTRVTNGEDVPWAEADRHCRDLELDGHRDWRLPTLEALETLRDPDSDGIRAPIELDACCLWSATSVAELPPENDGDTAGAPSNYYWGLLFDGGIRYYSFMRFPDGRALCTREPSPERGAPSSEPP